MASIARRKPEPDRCKSKKAPARRGIRAGAGSSRGRRSPSVLDQTRGQVYLV